MERGELVNKAYVEDGIKMLSEKKEASEIMKQYFAVLPQVRDERSCPARRTHRVFDVTRESIAKSLVEKALKKLRAGKTA